MTGANNFETFPHQSFVIHPSTFFRHHDQNIDIGRSSASYLAHSSFPVSFFPGSLLPETKSFAEGTLFPTISKSGSNNNRSNSNNRTENVDIMDTSSSRFPPMFQAALEVTPLHVTYRWWEDEGSAVLYAYDTREICQVIRFCLFVDRNLPKGLLLRRAGSLLDDFLGKLLLVEFGIQSDPTTTYTEKVDEVFRLLEPPMRPSTNWDWFPTQARDEPDARAIANQIDAESHRHFKKVSFEEWVRVALGYPSVSVNRFLLQHEVFFFYMSRYLEAYDVEIDRYLEVEKYMRTRSPFAHRVLKRTLLTCRPALSSELTLTAQPALDFLAKPLQHLFQNTQSLSEILKILSVLGNRFYQNYVNVSRMNWTQTLETKLPFLEDVFLSTEPRDLARTLTTTDQTSFGSLSRRDIAGDTTRAKKLQETWQSLSMEVYECCTAVPELVSYIHETIEALYDLKNYHSATAMMDGLRAYTISQRFLSRESEYGQMLEMPTVQPEHVCALLDSSDTYAVYLHQMQEAPGIPFLYPHIRQYQLIGEGAYAYLFR